MKFTSHDFAQWKSDCETMKRYIARQIPSDSTTVIELGDDAARLTPVFEGDELIDLLVEFAGNPDVDEYLDLQDVYQHFRWNEMTCWERAQQMEVRYLRSYRDRAKDNYWQSVRQLSATQKEIFEAADPEQPVRGEELVDRAGHDYNGHTKECLSHLVKLKLLENVRGSCGGYRKKVWPV